MKKIKVTSKNPTGFKVPDTYFESLEDAIFAKMERDSTFKDYQTPGFSTPDNYFSQVDAKIISQLKNSDSGKIVSLFNWKKTIYISGIAASILLIFNIFFNNTNQVSISDIETVSIENYLNQEDLNLDEISKFLSEEDLNSENFVQNDLNTEALEDYLLQNSDFENLITE